ncbi:MAG TPA: hypothetical protein VF789_05305 [Thermoanaerobaculia bacterium]
MPPLNIRLAALTLACLSTLAGSVPAAAQKQMKERSLKFGACEVITCNPNWTYTYTFQVTNNSAVAASQASILQPSSACGQRVMP